MPDPRLKGQEISIRVLVDSVVQSEYDSISNFNDQVSLELKEEGYLGELVNRFDEILNGFGGDFEAHFSKANHIALVNSIIDRAQRRAPATVFNVVRTDFFPNGETIIYTYQDVKWGSIPTSIGSRGDFVKLKFEFRCEERPTQVNSFA